MKYKVGDKVRIKSFDWYNENKDYGEGIIYFEHSFDFTESMSKYCGQIATITHIIEKYDEYKINLDQGYYAWTDKMFEGLAGEENKSNIIEDAKTYLDNIKDTWICPEGYIFKDENGNVINSSKIVLEKKEKVYPKTYKECCKILGVDPDNFLAITSCYEGEVETTDYERVLLSKFASLWGLRICRDAYWKLAGEEMSLRKPWEYDCHSEYPTPAIIYRNGFVQKVGVQYRNAFLTFPTEEMRDAFYDNFNALIGICKELL